MHAGPCAAAAKWLLQSKFSCALTVLLISCDPLCHKRLRQALLCGKDDCQGWSDACAAQGTSAAPCAASAAGRMWASTRAHLALPLQDGKACTAQRAPAGSCAASAGCSKTLTLGTHSPGAPAGPCAASAAGRTWAATRAQSGAWPSTAGWSRASAARRAPHRSLQQSMANCQIRFGRPDVSQSHWTRTGH